MSRFSIGFTRNTQPAAPVTATRTTPALSLTNTPTSAKRDAGFLNFYAARWSGKETDTITSPGLSAVS